MTTFGPFLGTLQDTSGNHLVCASDGVHLVLADTPPPPDPPPPTPAGSILLGAAGPNAANGSFAAQLASRRIQIGGTWNDSKDAQLAQWTIKAGAEWGSWNGPLDLAVGGIYKRSGDSWAAAANGQYDTRWRQALGAVRAAWAGRAYSLLYVRFAHELNGSFMADWSVNASEAGAYRTAFARWSALQREILPGSHVVWPLNDGGSMGFDFRQAYPGDVAVDLVGVDTYNQYPWCNDRATFDRKMTSTDQFGCPVGAEAWRQFAESKGKPLCLPEWANNADAAGQGGGGDSPFYVEAMHDWLTAHGGTGAGQVAYAVHFNLWDQFQMFPPAKKPQPRTWERYRQLF